MSFGNEYMAPTRLKGNKNSYSPDTPTRQKNHGHDFFFPYPGLLNTNKQKY